MNKYFYLLLCVVFLITVTVCYNYNFFSSNFVNAQTQTNCMIPPVTSFPQVNWAVNAPVTVKIHSASLKVSVEL